MDKVNDPDGDFEDNYDKDALVEPELLTDDIEDESFFEGFGFDFEI